MARFTKWQAYFVARAQIPLASCQRCIYFTPETTNSPPDCRIVERTSTPLPDEIRPTSTCALWNAGPTRLRLAEIFRGRGNQQGLAPGNARLRLEETFLPPPWTKPPPEVQKRLKFRQRTNP